MGILVVTLASVALYHDNVDVIRSQAILDSFRFEQFNARSKTLLRLLLDGEPLEKAANSMIEFIETKPECKQLVPYLKRAMETARLKERGCDAFIKLGEGWVAEEALAIGLWSSLLNSTDTRQALLDAVNHSGDSDSTGAIAGYIVGAANGVESIPKEWLEHLELRDLIEEQVNDLLKE